MSKEPDFKAFDDWLVDGPAGRWPHPYAEDKELTDDQKAIVEKNAKLILNEEAWSAHVQTFKEQLALIKDEEERSETRAMFEIRFDCHIFPDHQANFYGFHFPCSVSFRGATFGKGGVWFSMATFGEGNVFFDDATFGDGFVFFSAATFEDGYFSFGGVTFGDGVVFFDDTTFGKGTVTLDNIKLNATSIFFKDIDVGGNLFFRNTIFPKGANFQRASVKGTADFSGNTFHKVPDFRDAVFARPPEVAGMEVLPYAFTFMTPWWKGEKDEAAKFRKLKAMALAANDHEKDGEFFAYEMLAKRGYEKGSKSPFALFINWLYFTFSNFGQSYWRPFCWMVFSFFSFFVIYAIKAAPFLKPSELSTFAKWHSLSNTFPFFGSLSRFAPRPDDHKNSFDLAFNKIAEKDGPVDLLFNLGILQSFIGLILLFLLLLGLRNKFRLK